jgi:uncharacterized membrane protein
MGALAPTRTPGRIARTGDAGEGTLTAPPPGERDAGLERLTFLVDGVYAIALTLLAIELRLPEAVAHAEGRALRDALLDAWPRVLGFATSFALIAIFWSVQHRLFQLIRRADSRLVWLTLLQLACIAFLPFPTAIISEHPGDAVAGTFYFGAVMAASLASVLFWWYASAGRRLVDRGLSARVIWHYRLLILGGVAAPLLMFGLLALGVARLVSPLLLGALVTLAYIALGLVDWWEPR